MTSNILDKINAVAASYNAPPIRVRQKDLKALVQLGIAKDITSGDNEDIPMFYDRIAYSHGTYGCNGYLIMDSTTGEFYAVTARSTNLFRIM